VEPLLVDGVCIELEHGNADEIQALKEIESEARRGSADKPHTVSGCSKRLRRTSIQGKQTYADDGQRIDSN
jgi:hypothetical protein